MEFRALIGRRRSVRVFGTRPLLREHIEKIVRAASSAPSAGNLQAYEIVWVTQPAIRSALAHAAVDQDFIAQAPSVLIFFAHPRRSGVRYGRRGEDLYCLQDATIACAYAQLAAADLGLGSVWVGAFEDEAVSDAVGAPAWLRPVAILPIGYPAESPEPTSRRELSDILRKERFG